MKKASSICALLVCALLSACTGLNNNWNKTNAESIDQLLAEQQYSRAMELIASVNSDNPDYETLQQKRKAILVEINQFENDSIKLQKSYASKYQWPEAIDIIDNAIKKLPASEKLIEARQNVLKARDNYIQEKQLKLAINQAESLPQAIKLLESINSADPEQVDSAQALLVAIGQADSAQKTLFAQAKIETEKRNWRVAKKYLSLSKQLKADQETEQLLAETNRQIELENTRNNKSQQQAYIEKRDNLLAELEQSLNQQNYMQAKQLAKKLQQSNTQDIQIKQALTGYKEVIDKEVNTLTLKGQQLYTKGFIDQAITNWQKAQLLDQDNKDLQERLSRAETFKANIDKYK